MYLIWNKRKPIKLHKGDVKKLALMCGPLPNGVQCSSLESRHRKREPCERDLHEVLRLQKILVMESSIQIFNNPSFGEVRVTEVNGEPFFCLADVCKALDINNVSQCKTRLTEKGVIINDTLTKGGTQKMTFINESNLYKCIFQSRRPDAEKFQDWVFDEVLPSIRKHGAYMTSETLEKALLSPDYLIKLANILKEEKQKRIEAEKQNEILKPKAELMDKILNFKR
jgi:prophage antirepressor-like protein